MLYFANWKVLLICLVCALGVIFSIPNLFSPAQLDRLPRWLPHKQVSLGLDLRGGSYLLLQVDVGAAQHERLNALTDAVRSRLASRPRSATPGSTSEGDAIVFTIRDIRQASRRPARRSPRSSPT